MLIQFLCVCQSVFSCPLRSQWCCPPLLLSYYKSGVIYVPLCKDMKGRGWWHIHHSTFVHLDFWDGVSHWTWLASELPGSLFCSLYSLIVESLKALPDLQMALGDLNSVPLLSQEALLPVRHLSNPPSPPQRFHLVSHCLTGSKASKFVNHWRTTKSYPERKLIKIK